MRRVCVALGLGLALAAPVRAQPDEPKKDGLKPDAALDLVRKLRDNGLLDLAAQRLKELQANPALVPADQAPLVLFEVALNKLEAASRESEDARRAGLILQAQEAFAEFIRVHAKHPKVAQANVEIARLDALKAKSRLSRAGRLEGDARANAYSLARPDFDKAIGRYKQATVTLETEIKKLAAGDAQADDLTAARRQAELDTAVLEFEKARTYVTDGERNQKADGLTKAKKLFSALADKYAGNRVGFLAEVWAQQTDYENGDPRAAQLIERMVTANRANKEAADAVRLAGFFGIQHTFDADSAKDTSPAAKFQRTERAADAWLKAYPTFKHTPEGLGAMFRRALMKEQQAFLPGGLTFAPVPKAKAPSKKDPKEAPEAAPPPKIIGISATAKQLLEEANKIYKELTETDNEYTERAHRKRLGNQLIIMEGEAKAGDPPLKSINTLEQGVLYAQVQQARMLTPKDAEGRPLEGEAADKEVERRTRLAIEYLERALQRSTPRDAPRDVFDAQMLLVLFLTKSDRAMEAAVLGEALARHNPKAPKASTAAQLAVYAYNTALADLKKKRAADEDQAADLERIRKLGTFAVATWPTDGPTDAVRHVLAFYQGRAKDLEGAWTTYSQISPGYSAAAQARLEMGAVMFELVKPKTDAELKKYREVVAANITERATQWRATLRALETVPEPAESATHEAESWVRARTQLAQLYYMGADYDKVDAVIKAVVERVKKFTNLPADKRDDLAFAARALRYNALQAKIADLIKAKEFTKVGDIVDTDLAAMKAELTAKADPKAKETAAPNLDRMRRAQRDLLIASMSAFVQNKQADKANDLIDVLEKTTGGLESSVAVMEQLATSIRGQINELGKAGNKAEADGLRRSFGEFLDKIKGNDPAKLSTGVVTFLGSGYAAVDQHAKAAELYQTLVTKAADATQKRRFQFLQARAYREAGDKDSFDKATALMKDIVGNPLDPNPKAARGWGYNNLNIRKEYNYLQEDQKYFRPAIDNWLRLTREMFSRGLPPQVRKPVLMNQDVVLTMGPVVDHALHQALARAITEAFAAGPQATAVPMPLPSARAWFDFCFRGGLDAQITKRKTERNNYFDLYYEAQRCSAKAFSAQDPAKFKGGQEGINAGLTNIGQRLFDLVSKNDDVSEANLEKIQALLGQYPVMKAKYDALQAAGPKP